MTPIDLYKAGTLVPESWYTLTFKEGYSLTDYPDMKFQFTKDANVLEIGGKRYAQAVEPVENMSKTRDKFDVIAISGLDGALAHLHFSCVMLTYEHDMMAIVWEEFNKTTNKVLLAIKRTYRRQAKRAA